MNKTCARCSKTVYPLEELKCLDKTWHKGCFKCWECGMTLNMRTYKGFDKFPYCEAHIPKPKATTVAETPELQRLAENTKIQSNVKYHADFEKAKGKYTTVADDPETMRIKEASKMISNVSYHGDLQKKADMEQKRNLTGDDNGNLPSEQNVGARNGAPVKAGSGRDAQGFATDPSFAARQQMSQKIPAMQSAPAQRQPGYDFAGYGNYQQQQQLQQQQAAVLSSAAVSAAPAHNRQPTSYSANASRGGSAHGQAQAQGQSQGQCQPRLTSSQPPLDYYAQHQQHQQQQMRQQAQFGSAYAAGAPPGSKVSQAGGQRCFRALYDYTASDADEVSFKEGDLIIQCSPIEEGWMTGTVQRTRRTGMLPANYVEPAK